MVSQGITVELTSWHSGNLNWHLQICAFSSQEDDDDDGDRDDGGDDDGDDGGEWW